MVLLKMEIFTIGEKVGIALGVMNALKVLLHQN